jgi:hypothetical protein
MSYHLLSKSGSFEAYTQKESEGSVFVKGFASVETEDRQGEIVDPLEFNADTFVNTGTLLRNHKYISDAYGNHVTAGKVIAAEPAEIYEIKDGLMSIKSIRTGDHITELLEEKHPELVVGDRGLFVVAEVTNSLAKSEVEKGILNAFSWKGYTSKEQDGRSVRLKSVDLSEISLVHQPVQNQSIYVRIKDTDAKILANKLRITKLKFRSQSYKSLSEVKDYLSKRDIHPLEIRQSPSGYVAVLEDVSKYEVAKSVCIESDGCDLIAAPIKDVDQDFVASFPGEEPTTLVGEDETSMSQDPTPTPERQSYRFCVVDEAILQKLFPNSGRSEVLKSSTLALEDGEVANVEVFQVDISDEEISALFNSGSVNTETPATVDAVETTEVAAPEATVVAEVAPVETPNKDIQALFAAQAEYQRKTDLMFAELLKKDKDSGVSEVEKLRAELEATKAELARLIPTQDERDERAVAQKGKAPSSIGQMFSFLLN